jgi:hypothetical protein
MNEQVDLNHELSFKYYLNSEYRDVINKKYKKIIVRLTHHGFKNSFKHEDDILDLSVLARANAIIITRWGNEIINFDSLCNIRHLHLIYCRKVTDVGALTCVYSLQIRDCKKLTDISRLTLVSELDIVDCRQITDIGCQRKLKKLIVDYKNKLNGMHFLISLEELHIYGIGLTPGSTDDIINQLKYNKRNKNYGELKKLRKINPKLRIIVDE